jgi:hypothetical protein
MEKLENELASLRARAETLGTRHAASEAAFADAKAKLQRHHLEADDGDEKTISKLEAGVAAAMLKRDGFADALAEVRKLIAVTEQKLKAERETVERNAAADKLSADLDKVERALPQYLETARRLADALEAIHYHFEATQMAAFVANASSQLEVAGAFALQELRGTVNAIRDGGAPIPAPKPIVQPVAVIEAAPETRTVFAMKNLKYRGADGKTRYVGQYEDHALAPVLAQKALHCGAAVSIADERRRHLRGARGGDFNFAAPDVVDLDAVELPSLPYVGPDNPVLREAGFVRVDRGPDRVLKIAAPGF